MRFFVVILFSFISLTQVQAQSLRPFIVQGKSGLQSPNGKIILPPEYDAIGWQGGKLNIGNLILLRKGPEWLIYDQQERRIVFRELSQVEVVQNLIRISGRSRLSYRLTFGLVDSLGQSLLPLEYEGIVPAGKWWITYSKSGNEFRSGLYNPNNRNFVFPQIYKRIEYKSGLYILTNLDDRSAFATEDGIIRSEFQYDSLHPAPEYVLTFRDGMAGISSRFGSVLATPVYRFVQQNGTGVDVTLPRRFRFLTEKNVVVHEFTADSVTEASENLVWRYWNSRVWLIDRMGKPVSRQSFEAVKPFQDGIAPARDKGRWGLIDREGRWVIGPQFYQLQSTGKDWAAETNQGWIFIASPGLKIHPRVFHQIRSWNDSLNLVTLGKYAGLINRSGKLIVSTSYDSIVAQYNTFLVVKFNGRFAVIDLRENWILAPQHSEIALVNDSSYLEHVGDLWTVRNFKRQVRYFSPNKLIPDQGGLLEFTPEGIVRRDCNGITIREQTLTEVSPGHAPVQVAMTEGLQLIYRQKRFGFVDGAGRLRIANRYDSARPFAGNLAAVKIRGHWGFISAEDRLQIQPVYDFVSDFQAGRSRVRIGKLWGLIDPSGKPVLPLRYDIMRLTSTGSWLLRENGLFGVSSAEGRMLITPRYSRLEEAGSGFFIAAVQAKWGVINAAGLDVIPAIYDRLSYLPAQGLFLGQLDPEVSRLTIKKGE